MKKILGIVGSPRRKGNTHILVSKVLEGAEAEGALSNIIFLSDLIIRECDGCHTCWQGKPCSKKDDMNDMYPAIAGSDILVFGTPVYWYGPTALMKAFMDRFVYFNCPENRPLVRGKKAVTVIPFEEENPETGEFVALFFRKCFTYLEMKLSGNLIVPGVGDRGDVLKKQTIMDEAYGLGRRLAGGNAGDC
jgi:multimeric flavodoxin WrbA